MPKTLILEREESQIERKNDTCKTRIWKRWFHVSKYNQPLDWVGGMFLCKSCLSGRDHNASINVNAVYGATSLTSIKYINIQLPNKL